jgi:hypothetical protein
MSKLPYANRNQTFTQIKLLSNLVFISMAFSVNVQAARSPTVTYGSYVSHQVNVDVNGQNIADDKTNETTIAINPLEPDNIVIAWRQFAPFEFSIKQGGYGYSFDGGQSWTNGVLPVLPSIERTDPVLDVDSQGNFYFQSLAHGALDRTSIFKSIDGGVTWSEPVHQFSGDKNWLAIDKTGLSSDGTIYSTWRRGGGNTDPNYIPKYFIRSTDGGISYQEPSIALPVPNFGFGKIALGPEGDVYITGIDEDVSSINLIALLRGGYYFLKSLNAKDPNSSPTFSAKQVDMGGYSKTFIASKVPNPLGTDGDVQIAVDHSTGLMRGNIYMMAQTIPLNWVPGSDPLDVNFVRSSDGGETWSLPKRLNDDSPKANSFQWFPMLGVAPNSRIDAVWYDTRNGTGSAPYRFSQLFYSYSWDGGITWSQNQAVTPIFDTYKPSILVAGEESPADKMGDYTQLLSDANGAHIAYPATYNGEQDVYYLNVFPDCDSNKKSDVIDLQERRYGDTNQNHLPDFCENITVVGDIDGDRDVDQNDLNLVTAAKNKPASGANDPKDLDKNGVVNLLDVRKQVLHCTRPRCSINSA